MYQHVLFSTRYVMCHQQLENKPANSPSFHEGHVYVCVCWQVKEDNEALKRDRRKLEAVLQSLIASAAQSSDPSVAS